MSRLLCIGMAAALACACGRSDRNSDTTAATDTAAAQNPAPATVGTSGVSGATGSNQTIVLTGCLQRTSGTEAVGTSGSKGTPAPPDAAAAPSGDTFVLLRATAGEPDASGKPTGTSGVGANGAGASGGPLVTGTDSYVLDGANLVEHEHQTVRVFGHLPDPLAGGVLSGRAAADSATPGATTPAAGTNPNPGAARGAARANANGNDVAHMRHVTVDSVEMVAATCSAK